MIITELNLADFRNYKRQRVEFSPFVNIVMGENAQGKSNLLEALYLSAVGRSPRTARDKEMIRLTCDVAKVKVTAKKKLGVESVEIILDKAANKRIAVNRLPITRMGELMGVIVAVYFSPDEMRIIKDAPSDRRRFMDIALCQISRSYFYLLSRYNRIVSQRNKLLKSGKATEDTILPWDAQIADAGTLIIKTRRGFVENLSKYAATEHSFLTDNSEVLTLNYESVEGGDKNEVQENYLHQLLRDRDRDLKLGVTHTGPHKDDMGVFIGGVDARKFASQGQQRTAALSIKLAETALSAKLQGEQPVLLLDDVLGELDKNRQKALLKRIGSLQSVITCTHLEDDICCALGECKLIRIRSGAVII
ncbi:MAG: DNA replication/repair protein RecF [Firmicutes bacterium]|nr:DNA replication/repair protein RecF [Bacillota bacterium]